MTAWQHPDPSSASIQLDGALPVQVVERHGDFARVICSNGFTGWVDGRLLP
jgi:SH3-like domain-containing protein